ncbi:extended synaptotagmin-3 [Eurytemora carolleeae]|uniref:extended synaptotagmin-3 n=1 Tax=Eurytemora carolleeae TaxID=1294199 RepID=UPI000C78C883|nr:extended synaptotagmin-3 [Eurytemora carolleeae]|eukprot:XP_023341241.1 extended synaptotagmin-3-like [Eurytemora affinis]
MKVWGGLDDLEVKGTIRIHVFISGKGGFFDYIQFGFLETPVLKFDLEGGANILDFPLLRTHIRDGLDDILETNLVSPNLLTINIRDRTDNSLYPNPIPAGVVRVDQIRGLNLPYKDLGFLGSRVDPYCTVSIGSDLKKTRILKDEPNPIWSETFWFPLRNPTGLKLKIQLIDWDRGSQDDEIKDLEVDLSPIIKSQRTFTFPVNQEKRKRSERGELLIRASWFSLLPLEQYISSKSGPTVISLSVGNLSLQYPSAQEWVKLYIETRLGRISSGWFLIPDQEKMVAKSCLLALDRGFQDDDITLSIRTWSNEVLLEHVLSPNLLDNSRRTIIAGGARKRLCLEYQGILFLARHGERQGFNLLEDSESEPPEFGTHNSRNKIRCQEQIYLDETLNPEKLNLGCQDLGSETWRHIDSGEPSLEPCHL